MTTPGRHLVSLPFAVTEDVGGPPGEYAVTVKSVVRDQHGIRVNYEVAPPLMDAVISPWAEAKDDLGNRYDDRGGAYGLDGERNVTAGVMTLMLPSPDASRLVVRIAWDDLDDIWASRAYELHIDLTDSPDGP